MENNCRQYVQKFNLEQALGFAKRPIVLYAAAQCRKDQGAENDIESLAFFSEALKTNSNKTNNWQAEDFLTDLQVEAARGNIEDLLKRYVQLNILLPSGEKIKGIKINK